MPADIEVGDSSRPVVDPAPELIMASNGIYWRRYPEHLSMVPTSDDNDPVIGPLAVYKLVGYEQADGALIPLSDSEQSSVQRNVVKHRVNEARRTTERLEAENGVLRSFIETIAVMPFLRRYPGCPGCVGRQRRARNLLDKLGPKG